ncbi:hypothetical protein HZB01_04690 [Candidatus Woesearchaeota archaeon]|nr:hypothetical protein [Candidatus Woesearchaeota archaeon]
MNALKSIKKPMKIGTPLLLATLLVKGVQAHCPLCTIGVAAVAGGAMWLGVNTMIISLFVGAFAVSTGWWVGRMIKKKYIPYQTTAIVLASFLLTIIPLLPLLKNIYPIFISWTGDYGSLLNRTYIIDLALVGSMLGGAIVAIAPWLSSRISALRKGKILPFQGVLLTLALLVVTGAIIQVMLS